MSNTVLEWIDDIPADGFFTKQNLWKHQLINLTEAGVEQYYRQYIPISMGIELPKFSSSLDDPVLVWINNGENRIQEHVERVLGLKPDLVEHNLFSDQALGKELPKNETLSLLFVPFYRNSHIYVADDAHPVFDLVLNLEWLSVGTHPLGRLVIDTITGNTPDSLARDFTENFGKLSLTDIKMEDGELLIRWSGVNEGLVKDIREWIEESDYIAINVNDEAVIYGIMELATMFGATIWNNCLVDKTLFPNHKYLILSSTRPEFDALFFESQARGLERGLPLVRFSVSFPVEYDHYARLYSTTLAYEVARQYNPTLPEDPVLEVYTDYVKIGLSNVTELDLIREIIKQYKNLVNWIRAPSQKAALYYAQVLRDRGIRPVLRQDVDQWIVMYDDESRVELPPLYITPPFGKNDTTIQVLTPEFEAFDPNTLPTIEFSPTLDMPPISFSLVPSRETHILVAKWLVQNICPKSDSKQVGERTLVLGPVDTGTFRLVLSLWLGDRLTTDWGRCYWNYMQLPSYFMLSSTSFLTK